MCAIVMRLVLTSCGIAVVLSCLFVVTKATPARGALIPSHRNEEDEYDWLCPRVVCNPLPTDCELWEYIVLDYSYRVRRKYVNVRCQSCPYCLDLPKGLNTRKRRSLYELLGWTTSYTENCSDVRCPSLPDECTDVRLTDVIVRGRLCKQCPACYDNMLITDKDTV